MVTLDIRCGSYKTDSEITFKYVSLEADATILQSREKQQQFTTSVWPAKVFKRKPVWISQI